MKKIVKYVIGVLVLVLALSTVSFAKEAIFEESDSQITVRFALDKDSYKEGEAISYYLEVDNQKQNWRITKLDINPALPKGFSFIEGSSYSYDDMVESGEKREFTGGITNSGATSFVSMNPEKIKWSNSTTGAESKKFSVEMIIYMAAAFLLLAFIIIKVKNAKKVASIIIAIAMAGSVLAGIELDAQASYANPEITIRPYCTVMYGGEELTVRMVVRMTLGQEKQNISAEYKSVSQRICCHDPSIFKDFDGKYYVIGSFLATGSSDNLNDWTSNDKELQGSFTQEVKDKIKAWNDDDSAGSWNGYLWAPDIIYNTSMNKYCMYLSANGDYWKSNIVLLTSDSIYGPYDYSGSIVYGGFTQDDISETDVLEVVGGTEIPDRYVTYGKKNGKWGDMYPNCIDPCVFYDEEGNLWMSYGSWSGGIFMLALDENTGLRDYSVKYETDIHSDAYFGTKIAGGAYVSGEASYIQHIGDYYYLFISYGNLEAKGGYNIRVFRSDRPDGDYVDELGNTPYYDKYVFNYSLNNGERLFGGYKWRTMEKGEVAQGHNSAFVDDDGKAYIVFHTRTTDGSEGHYVKVHQLFVNKEGWLVAAPYMTDGEARSEVGITMKEAAGTYELIIHNLDIDYKNLDVNKSCVINLNEDGTITGEHEGSWTIDEGTDFITLILDGESYSGVSLQMNIENSTLQTYVFTALGTQNQISIWGSRMVE